jgi:uncharacterized protein (DUF2336 family)
MHRVADLFFEFGPRADGPELVLFDDILSQLSQELESRVRAELANRMALARTPPRALIRSLALDETIDVASPVLQLSRAVAEEDLIEVARSRSEAHLKAISRRSNLPVSVSDLIIERAEESTLEVLLANASASLSRMAHERLVDRAMEHPSLQGAVVRYANLLNEMYFVVESRMRNAILQRNARIRPEDLDEALRLSRHRVTTRKKPVPEDFEAAQEAVKAAEARGGGGPNALVRFLRNGETTAYLIAISQMAGVDFETTRTIHERRELDALSIICKAAGFDRTIFITLAVLVLGRENNPMGRAREYGEIYEALPREVARRTVRFWASPKA